MRRKPSAPSATLNADAWSGTFAKECKASYRAPSVFARQDYADKLDELRRQVSCYTQEIDQLREDLRVVRERNLQLEAQDILERTSINIIEEED